MKKILCTILTIALLLSAIPVSAELVSTAIEEEATETTLESKAASTFLSKCWSVFPCSEKKVTARKSAKSWAIYKWTAKGWSASKKYCLYYKRINSTTCKIFWWQFGGEYFYSWTGSSSKGKNLYEKLFTLYNDSNVLFVFAGTNKAVWHPCYNFGYKKVTYKIGGKKYTEKVEKVEKTVKKYGYKWKFTKELNYFVAMIEGNY